MSGFRCYKQARPVNQANIMHSITSNATIKAITFDLDDTLWDNRPVLYAAEQTLFNWLVDNYPRIGDIHDVVSFRQMRLNLAREREDLRHHMTRLRLESLRLLAEMAGYDHSLVKPAFEVFIEARHAITLYEDVIPALEKLREDGFLLGALTNGNANVKRLGLDHLFDFSFSAEDAQAAKPDPTMFHMVLEQAGINADQLAHVGDEAETDIYGALNAGAFAVWMNRLGHAWHAENAPHAEIRNMDELLTLAENWNR